jgi:cellulose 1,4-beta-cellobiosidase
MDADGGMSKDRTNKAGAKYGTGYCDAQCPRDLKFINGLGNINGWNPSGSDQNAGVGEMGSCCSEMDIWEANKIATAYTPHPCTTVGQHMCKGDSCGGTYSADRYGGTCDPDGCDFNSYRQGNREFYGPGMTVDTGKKFTVVTQFIEEGGKLSAIRRFYVQGGKVIPNSESVIDGNTGNEINPDFCEKQKLAFGDGDIFNQKGGFDQFTKAVSGGMVLVMSLWDDHYSNMLWLDATYPTDASADTPGKGRGTCEASTGKPEEIEKSQGSDQVIYSYVEFPYLHNLSLGRSVLLTQLIGTSNSVLLALLSRCRRGSRKGGTREGTEDEEWDGGGASVKTSCIYLLARCIAYKGIPEIENQDENIMKPYSSYEAILFESFFLLQH